MTAALSISSLINIQTVLTPAGAQAQNTSTLLILSNNSVIDSVERYRIYNTLAALGADFGTTAPEYLAAQMWFAQVPQPTLIQIGKWAKTASSGVLRGGVLSAGQQAMTAWTAVTSGGVDFTIDGSAKILTALDFHLQTSLNGVASVITTALAGAGSMVWNSVYNRFELTSASTGTTSTVAFATTGGGTDISTMLGMTSAGGGYTAAGLDAETALAAITLFDANYGQNWYAATVIGAVSADHTAIGSYIEAATNKHLYGVTTQDSNVLTATDTTNVAYLLQQLGLTRTSVQYSSSNAYAVCSYLGRLLTTNYTGNNTVITLMYKNEPLVAAEDLTTPQLAALAGFNCNVFVAYNNNKAIIQNGVQSSGLFTDIIAGVDYFVLGVETDLFNALYTSTTKIPETDAGNVILSNVIESRCAQGVTNGLIGPGTWTANGFGALNTGDFMAKGYYIYTPPIATQNPTDRAARKSVPFQIGLKLEGAIHTVFMTLNVNQ